MINNLFFLQTDGWKFIVQQLFQWELLKLILQ